jgi:type IV secretory pathway VirB10-like protein
MNTRILLAAFLALALPAGAAMYKWVDEKGVTHYSETPPPEGTQSKKIEIAPAPPSATTARPETADDWKARELQFRERRLKKQHAEADEKAKSEEDAERRKQRCLTARNKVDILQHGGGVYHVDERGERVYMGDEERGVEVLKWREAVKTYCDS